MSSQNILTNPKVVLWSLFALRWVFLIASIYTVYQIYLDYSLFNIGVLIVFMYFLGKFYVLEKAFYREMTRELREETYKYNKAIEEINSKNRNTRRSIIRILNK
jgi:hypothetical protein